MENIIRLDAAHELAHVRGVPEIAVMECHLGSVHQVLNIVEPGAHAFRAVDLVALLE